MVKIATWNVNSAKARLPNILGWLERTSPDVVLFQEIKCETAGFPKGDFEALGYNCVAVGQKSYNGVALLAKQPIEDVLDHLPGAPEDVQARYVEATVGGLRIASLYLPNGNPVGTEKYPYKLKWMERLRQHAQELLKTEQPFVLGGDYNIIPARRRRLRSAGVGNRRPVQAGEPRPVPGAAEPGPDRSLPGAAPGRAARLYLLGLSGRPLAARPGHPHRPFPAVAPGGRPAGGMPDRQRPARRGEGVGPHPRRAGTGGLISAASWRSELTRCRRYRRNSASRCPAHAGTTRPAAPNCRG